MTMHAVMHFPYSCELSSVGGNNKREFQVEGETEEEIMLQVEQLLERYYSQFFKGKPTEVRVGFCEDGEPINLIRLGDKYTVKVSVTMMLEPKKAGSVKRKAKRFEEEDDDGYGE